ncbi:MAG: GNAT family N-acetyltransferase [Anaerolineaceae bacterium]|nr:GNAT family N-acetyltransferase [Anaerolineaceae bacterium]
MPHRIPYKICTPRLVLRCWQPQDAALLKEAVDASLDHLRPWMPWAADEPEPLHMKVDGLRKFRGRFDLDQEYVYGIFDPQEAHALGSCGLHKRIGEGALEIGYWIHAARINQGYATEAAAALTKIAFLCHHVNRIEILCNAQNSRSAAVPKKLGYHLDAVLRRRPLSGVQEEHDTMLWSLFADEFPGSPSQAVKITTFDASGEPLIFE